MPEFVNQYKQNMGRELKALGGGEIQGNDVDIASEFQIPEKTHEQIILDVKNRSEFLKKINIHLVDHLKGNTLGLSMRNDLLKRTNQDAERHASVNASAASHPYVLDEVEIDFLLSYAKEAGFADFPKFKTNLIDVFGEAEKNSMQWLGFNGTSASTTQSTVATKEIVSKGWLQKLEENKSEQIISTLSGENITVGSEEINLFGEVVRGEAIGSKHKVIFNSEYNNSAGSKVLITGTEKYNGHYTLLETDSPYTIAIEASFQDETLSSGAKGSVNGHFETLDGLVNSLKELIPDGKRDGLEVFLSSDLLSGRMLSFFNQLKLPTELLKTKELELVIGGLAASSPAFMPENTLVIANPKNISIYIHKTRRYQIKDDPAKKGTIFYRLWYQSYELEEYDRIAVAKNINLVT